MGDCVLDHDAVKALVRKRQRATIAHMKHAAIGLQQLKSFRPVVTLVSEISRQVTLSTPSILRHAAVKPKPAAGSNTCPRNSPRCTRYGLFDVTRDGLRVAKEMSKVAIEVGVKQLSECFLIQAKRVLNATPEILVALHSPARTSVQGFVSRISPIRTSWAVSSKRADCSQRSVGLGFFSSRLA